MNKIFGNFRVNSPTGQFCNNRPVADTNAFRRDYRQWASVPNNINAKRESNIAQIKIPKITPLITALFPSDLKHCNLLYAVNLYLHNGGIERQPQRRKSECLHSLASATQGDSPKGGVRSNDLVRALAARPRLSSEAQFRRCAPLFGAHLIFYISYINQRKSTFEKAYCQVNFMKNV